jgi:hypothetical protein
MKDLVENMIKNFKIFEKKLDDIINQSNDEKIYSLISDWIISSLINTEKRQKIGDDLSLLNIPNEYKFIPSDYVYRIQTKMNNSAQKYVSYTYDVRGINNMKNWLKKIFNLKDEQLKIDKVLTSEIKNKVLICIPTFLKKTGFSSGKRFDQLWKNEYEIIIKND